jgi:hypothetical protein
MWRVSVTQALYCILRLIRFNNLYGKYTYYLSIGNFLLGKLDEREVTNLAFLLLTLQKKWRYV